MKRHETTINFISFSKMKKRKTDFLVFHCGRGKKKGYLIASLCFIISDRLHENRTITVSLLFVLVSRYFKVEKKKKNRKKKTYTHGRNSYSMGQVVVVFFFFARYSSGPADGNQKESYKRAKNDGRPAALDFHK